MCIVLEAATAQRALLQDAAKTNLAFVNPSDRLASASYLDINGM